MISEECEDNVILLIRTLTEIICALSVAAYIVIVVLLGNST